MKAKLLLLLMLILAIQLNSIAALCNSSNFTYNSNYANPLLATSSVIRIEDAPEFGAGYCSIDGARQNTYQGADNGFYINLTNSVNRGITWKIHVPAAGSYELKWRFANGGSNSARTAQVLVNGQTAVADIPFPKTTSWSTWATTVATVQLTAGVNTIRLETTVNAEFANIDWIEITGNSPTPVNCDGTIPAPPQTYTLQVSAQPEAAGQISINPAGGTYNEGTSVTITAHAAEGYKLQHWSGDASGTSNSITLTMDANKTVSAHFVEGAITYVLEVNTSPAGSGQVTLNPAGGTYAAGTVVTLTATPASSHIFTNWSGAANGHSKSTTLTMDGNKTATAHFISATQEEGIDFSLAGFATLAGGTSGGYGGNNITVTTGTELQAAINNKPKTRNSPLVIYVAGTITPANSPGLSKIEIKERYDISILGVGTLGEFDGIGIRIFRASNIILRNLKVHHVTTGDKDCINIEGPADHIWVDHCELYNEFQGVHQDYYDGLLDAKSDAEYITFSWNYLHDSWKASLIGFSDSDNFDRKVTYHHNYFRNINSRLPLFRFGTGHVFNNYYQDVASTAANSRMGACLKIENNFFKNVNNPYVTAYSSQDGFGDISGNTLENSPFKYASDTRELTACSLEIPYPYEHVLHATADVPDVVKQNAGVGVINVYDNTVTGMSNEKINHGFRLYPNPSSGMVTIDLTLTEKSPVTINIYNITSTKVAEISNRTLTSGLHTFTFDSSMLKPGIYFCQAETSKGTISRKLVVK